MFKKIVLLVALMMSGVAVAQNVIDSWLVHPFYVSTSLQKIVDTGDKVYYLTGGYLYCYYKDTQENESLNSSNYLNDVTITGIYLNTDTKNLFVAYENGNIDVIDSDGKITNIADILNSKATDSKGIKDITFTDGYAYVATEFGYVVINESNFLVKESRIYGSQLASVAHVGNWMVVSSENFICTASDQDYNEYLSYYTNSGMYRANASFTPIDDTRFLVASDNGIDLCTIDGSGNVSFTRVESTKCTFINKTKDGYIGCFPSSNFYLTLDADGLNPTKYEVEEGELATSATTGDGTVWGINANGLHQVGDNVNYFKPNAIGITTNAFYTAFSTNENKLYLANTTDNTVLTTANLTLNLTTEIWTYDGNKWEDATPEDVPLYNNGEYGYQGGYDLHFVPDATGEYLFSTRAAGICHVKDGKVVNVYYFDNMPRDDKYKCSLGFDSNGNLYAVQSYNTKDHPVMILPKANLASPSSVTSDSWITPTVNGIEMQAFKRSSFVVAQETDIKVYTAGEYNSTVVVWNDGGNIRNTSPTVSSFTQLTDQDGGEFAWNYVRAMASDLDGTIWLGTDIGIIAFDPSQASSSSFTGTRFKVPRNDGTDLADYLLDGIEINCITVDASGRKWIGTNNDGLFLVSSDGTSILKSFTASDSPLVSDCIYSVCCDPNSNSVYVATSRGVMEYFSDVVPASSDYSTVHVYPNPVRPEYGNLVTIAGLMENSVIKIVDAAGNVFKTFKSEGGIATWDCCNDSGDSVSSGVYYVIASQNENDNGSSVVSKFVVIK